MVHNDGGGVVDHSEPALPQAKAKVAVLVIRRGEAVIKATKVTEACRVDEQTGARAIVDIAHIAVLWPVWIIVEPDHVGSTVWAERAACFLQMSGGIDN